jgi:hypothetical protein
VAGQGKNLPAKVAQHLWARPVHTQMTAWPHTHKAYTNILTQTSNHLCILDSKDVKHRIQNML